jgi:uncharacterized protein YbjT (DUF2867 family)
MQILVLGGSGLIGKVVLSDALARGHTITALVRNPASLSELQSPLLQVLQGPPQKKVDMINALTPTPDAIITALRSTEEGFMASVHRIVVEVIKEKVRKVRRRS